MPESGLAPLDAESLVPAANLRAALTIEEVANSAARAALTVLTAEVGKRLVRQADTGVVYMASATGSGTDKWVQYRTDTSATTSVSGAVELATNIEARTRTDTARVLTPSTGNELVADLVNPRAAAQGLVFNGTAGASAACPVAIGTGAFTFEAVIEIPLTAPSGDAGFFFLSDVSTSGLRPYCFIGYMTSTGVLSFSLYGATASDYRLATVSGFHAAYAGKMVHISFARPSAGNPTLHVNGVSTSLSLSSNGSAPTWQGTVYSSYIGIGSYSTTALWTGAIHRPALYNREHSTADVIARYEDGRPLAADYNNANGTSLITGDASTFATDNAFWVKGVGTTISGGKANFTSDSILQKTNFLTIGRRYQATFTVSGYTSGVANMNNGSFVEYQSITANGTYTVEFTAQVTSTLQFSTGSGVTWSLDDVTLLPLGAVFAPEANAPGNGYQWRDMSGNKADVLLPVTGVSWALPDLRPNFFRASLSWAGTNEAKALRTGGGRIFPDGAMPTLFVGKANATSGSANLLLGTSNSNNRWHTGSTFTTAKKIFTLNNALPASSATNDNDILADLDANWTGTIEIEAHYNNSGIGS